MADTFPIITRYLKFKTICNEPIPILCDQLLTSLTPPGHGRKIRCDYVTGTSRSLPYGPSENKEICIVMRLELDVTINKLRDLDYADGLDTVQIEIINLENPGRCLREARANRFIYSNRFEIYYEDTRYFPFRLDKLVYHDYFQVDHSESQFNIIHLNEHNTGVNISSLYQWDNVRNASKILNMPQSFRNGWITAFVYNASMGERTANVYSGRRNKFGRKIYKKKMDKYINNPLPRVLIEEIFFRYVKREKFKCVYTEIFESKEFIKDDGSRFIATVGKLVVNQ